MGYKLPRPFIIGSGFATAFTAVYLLKTKIHGGLYEHKQQKMTDKIVIVTGANTGIGKQVVFDFASRDAKVIMACRSLYKCEKARKEIILKTKNKYVYCRECDLASQESIRKFVEQFNKEHEKLNILVNNAGIMRCPQSYTKEGIETQFGVNHIGHFLLTNLLLDKLKTSAPSRIIMLSGPVYRHGKLNMTDLNLTDHYDAGAAYAQSKLAVMLFTKELAEKLKDSGVTVNAVYPGLVNSDLGRHMAYYNNYFAKIFTKPILWFFLKPPVLGAQPVIHAALHPSLEHVTGAYISNYEVTEVNDTAKDQKLSKWLWAVSEKWTGLEKVQKHMS